MKQLLMNEALKKSLFIEAADELKFNYIFEIQKIEAVYLPLPESNLLFSMPKSNECHRVNRRL